MEAKTWGSLFSADVVLMCCLFYAYEMTIIQTKRQTEK